MLEAALTSLGDVQALAEFLPGLEIGHRLVRDLHLVAGARVAADPGVTPADRERAEAPQLDPIAAREGRS